MGWTKIDMQLQRLCHPATAKYATFLPVRVHAFPSPECGFMHVMVLNGIDLWYRLNTGKASEQKKSAQLQHHVGRSVNFVPGPGLDLIQY